MVRDIPTLDAGVVVTASAVFNTPVTNQGWRPISVTYQPASTATQPEKVIPTNTFNNNGENSLRRPLRMAMICQQPHQETRSINIPNPTMMRKPKNNGITGGCAPSNSLSPFISPSA